MTALLDDIGIVFDRLLGWLLKWSSSQQNAMLLLSLALFFCLRVFVTNNIQAEN
jgi:hypothetical protein